MIQHTTPLTERQPTTLSNGGKIVVLSPDDLLTLKLLRDSWLKMASVDLEYFQPCLTKGQINETLNRILNQ